MEQSEETSRRVAETVEEFFDNPDQLLPKQEFLSISIEVKNYKHNILQQ